MTLESLAGCYEKLTEAVESGMHANLPALHQRVRTGRGMLDRVRILQSMRSMWAPVPMHRANPAWLERAAIRRTHHECGHTGVLGLLMGQNGGTRFAVDTVRSYQDVTCLAGAILEATQES